MQIAFTVEDTLEILGAERTVGHTTAIVTGIASLELAGRGDLSFLGNWRYREAVPDSNASVILLPEEYEGTPRHDQLYVYLPNPSMALATLCERIEKKLWPQPPPGIHPTAIVDPTAAINPTVHIGPLCVVEEGAIIEGGTVLEAQVYLGKNGIIGRDCRLMPQVTVASYCQVGDRVRLHAGVVIGSDGYGYENIDGVHHKVPQIGSVLIEDDVEIGANTTIDRARFGQTRIGQGTKIDNLVHIGHNVTIGHHCLIVAQAGISGSTRLEDFVAVGGQVGIVGHVTIGKGSKIGGQSGVTRSLPPGSYEYGTPSNPTMLTQRIHLLLRRLPEIFKRVANLEELLEVKEKAL